MAKKSTNKKKELVSNESAFNEADLVVTGELKCDTIEIGVIKTDMFNKSCISNINIMELIALEKACSLLCKRYETMARIDSGNNSKFKEFKKYYEMIFSELENRVYNSCNV